MAALAARLGRPAALSRRWLPHRRWLSAAAGGGAGPRLLELLEARELLNQVQRGFVLSKAPASPRISPSAPSRAEPLRPPVQCTDKVGLAQLVDRAAAGGADGPRVYAGFDPTAPSLHIGHLVGLR